MASVKLSSKKPSSTGFSVHHSRSEEDLRVPGLEKTDFVDDDLDTPGKDVANEHRLEYNLHIPRKHVAEEHRLNEYLHVPETEIAQEHRVVDDLNESGKEAAGEHHVEYDISAVWDRCFEHGKRYIRTLLRRGLFPPADILDELCDCYGRKSRIVADLCSFAKQKIKKEIETTIDTKVVDIYPSFKDGAENKIVFVVTLNKRVNKAEIRGMVTYAVEIKILNTYNKESTLLAQHILKEKIFMKQEELRNVQSCQESIEEDLFAKHKYLSMIASAPVKSYQYSERGQHLNIKKKICLQLFVHAKCFIPIWEDPFEKKYGGIDTDVIECVFVSFGGTAREPHDNIKMGCRIQRKNRFPKDSHHVIKGGTLGGFIEHPELGLCGITCAHAMLYPCEFEKCKENNKKLSSQEWPLEYKENTAVYQPDEQLHSTKIGLLSEAHYDTGDQSLPGIDIALIKICNRHPINGMFPLAEDRQQGERRKVSEVYESGTIEDYKTLATDRDVEVWKFGSTTDSTNAFLSIGSVTAREIDFEWQNDDVYNMKLHKQIRVTNMDSVPFALPGDSGALVFHKQSDGQLACIGMVEGGYNDNHSLAVVAPIIPVLERLNVKNIYTFSDTKLYRMEARLERNFTKVLEATQTDFEILKANQAEILRKIESFERRPCT